MLGNGFIADLLDCGFSPRSIVVVMPVTLVTNRYATVYRVFLPAGGMVATMLQQGS